MIGIFELMVNLSTENALHCIIIFFRYWCENQIMPKQSEQLCTLSEENACPCKLFCFLNLTPLFKSFKIRRSYSEGCLYGWLRELVITNTHFLLPFRQV